MKLSNEPIVWLAVLRAAIVLGTSFGFQLTEIQTGAIYLFAEALSTLFGRQVVTPSHLAEQRVAMGYSPTEPLPNAVKKQLKEIDDAKNDTPPAA